MAQALEGSPVDSCRVRWVFEMQGQEACLALVYGLKGRFYHQRSLALGRLSWGGRSRGGLLASHRYRGSLIKFAYAADLQHRPGPRHLRKILREKRFQGFFCHSAVQGWGIRKKRQDSLGRLPRLGGGFLCKPRFAPSAHFLLFENPSLQKLSGVRCL